MGRLMHGKVVVRGQAQGELLASVEPLSFWGGYNQNTGEIIDRRHPLSGQIAAGKVLALPYSRGSSTTTAILLESIRSGNAPAAILTRNVDTFFALASIVAEEMYGKAVPIVSLSPEDFGQLETGQTVRVEESGEVVIE